MAEIIDLDFYRKFRVVLPVQSSAFTKNKSHKEDSQASVKPCRRRRKTLPRLPSRPKNRGGDGSL